MLCDVRIKLYLLLLC